MTTRNSKKNAPKIIERCCACGNTHERDNCLEAAERDSWLDEICADDGPIHGYDY